MSIDDLLAEQVEYYRRRAPEYDEWFLRRGRYDRGVEFRIVKVFHEPAELRARLATLGWHAEVERTQSYFVWGRAEPGGA